jgi:ABC-2 type transport system permease protein
VYLGVRVRGVRGEKVIPFFDRNAAVEYELTRTIGSVVGSEPLTVGILRTDARVLGMGKPWYFDQFVKELRQQYKVVDVTHANLSEYLGASPKFDLKKDKKDDKKNDDAKHPDVLVVVQASSLPSGPMGDLVKYVKKGRPALVFDDPLPFYLVADQTTLQETLSKFGIDVDSRFEVLDAPKLPRAQPLSLWSQELVPRKTWDDLLKWWEETGSRMPIRSRQQFEMVLAGQMNRMYPEATPQVSAAFPGGKADNGTASPLFQALGLQWNNGEVVADAFNPHPTFRPNIPPKVVEKSASNWPAEQYGKRENALLFLTRDRAGARSLSSEHAATKGLNEVLAIYPGHVNGPKDVKPLLWAPAKASKIAWSLDDPAAANGGKKRGNLVVRDEVILQTLDPNTGTVETKTQYEKSQLRNTPSRLAQTTGRDRWFINEDPHREVSRDPLFIAVHVKQEADGKKDAGKSPLNTIFVADVDLISDFAVQQQSALDQPLDNLNFVFNAIESLAGRDGFLSLRGRRVNSRALTAIQSTVDEFRLERFDEEEKIKRETRKKTEAAQKRFDEKIDKIRKNKGLSVSERDQLLVVALETERRRLKLEIEQLNRQKEQTIQELKNKEERRIRDYQNRVRYASVALPPIPALLLGLAVLASRFINERRNINPNRRA